MNRGLDFDDNCTYDYDQWEVVSGKAGVQQLRAVALERDSICTHVHVIVLAINHEQMVGSWWHLPLELMFIRQGSWSKVKVTSSKVKVKYAIIQKLFGL